MKKRIGIISKCQALGSWIIVTRRDNGYYTLPLSKESIESYVSLQKGGKLIHEYEGKSVPFTIKMEMVSFGTIHMVADITNPCQPKKRIKRLHLQ